MGRLGGKGRTLAGRAINTFFLDALKTGTVMETLKKFEYKQGVARKREFFARLKKEGLTDKDITQQLGNLIRSGDVFCPRPDFYRRTAYRPQKRRRKK